MPTLRFVRMQYQPCDLEAWKDGDYSILRCLHASKPLQSILCAKARTRREGRLGRGRSGGDRRFFGEAFVAGELSKQCDAAWYGSFKWLTSPTWLAETPASDNYATQFGEALRHHFGRHLEKLQTRAEKLCGLPNCAKPMPPDLWLIADGRHRFIEVKLPGDTIRGAQLAGLALIATSLPATTVEIVTLNGGCRTTRKWLDREEAALRRADEEFSGFCRKLKASSSVPDGEPRPRQIKTRP